MIQIYSTKQKSLIRKSCFYYISIMSWMGRFLLIVPMAFAILMASLWGNFTFFWAGVFFGWIGWFLLVSLNYVKSFHRKDLTIQHILYAGPIVLGACLLCILIRLNVFAPEASGPQKQHQIPVQFDPVQKGTDLMVRRLTLPPSGELRTEGGA
jgi:hypothetical protein